MRRHGWLADRGAKVTCAAALAASFAFGGERVASAASSATAPGSGKQRALAVEATAAGVRANVCEPNEAKCDAAKGALFVPPEAARAEAARAEVASIDLASGKRVVRVSAKVGDATWSLILAAPADGAGEAVVVWGGWSGRPAEESGTRTDHQVAVGKGRVVIRDRRDDVSVCGRGAWVNARAIDPATLALVPDAAEDPIASARASAEVVEAVEATSDAAKAPSRARLLAPLAGSRPGAAVLADDDPKTAWAPLGPSAGAFETATFVGAPEVPIEAIDVVLVPYAADAKKAAPRSFVLATPDRVVRVKLPGGAIAEEGRTYHVAFAKPLAARCVALVLEPAAGGAASAIAEVRPRTVLDTVSLDAIARGLGSPDGAARAAYLLRAGKAGFDAVVAAYGVLDGQGQDMARRVIDAGDCAVKAPFYVQTLGSRDEAIARRASDRVIRCGDGAVPALRTAIDAAGDKELGEIAEHLALAAPEKAVPDLLARLAASPEGSARRLVLRKALARAVQRPRAAPAVQAALAPEAFGSLAPEARLDLVRAAATRLAATPGGKEAFASLAATETFRVRYLLAPAAAELVRGGDAGARAWLERAMTTDADPRMRARASSLAGFRDLAPVLARAARDADPRVREGALVALARPADRPGASGAGAAAPGQGEVFERGLADEWTFVREAAANGAAAWPSEPRGDAALVRVMTKDPLARVRRVAVRALGLRGARAALPLVRARAADAKEEVDVRAEALGALGALCDTASLTSLTEQAHKAAAPFSEVDRKLGAGAIDALRALHPADLRERLAPLVAPGAPLEARQLAQRALASPGSCPRH